RVPRCEGRAGVAVTAHARRPLTHLEGRKAGLRAGHGALLTIGCTEATSDLDACQPTPTRGATFAPAASAGDDPPAHTAGVADAATARTYVHAASADSADSRANTLALRVPGQSAGSRSAGRPGSVYASTRQLSIRRT